MCMCLYPEGGCSWEGRGFVLDSTIVTLFPFVFFLGYLLYFTSLVFVGRNAAAIFGSGKTSRNIPGLLDTAREAK